ncbi:MAG: methylated-DNA--[protein]-cysteine S-methyltransferase [Candidatus Peribacteraceae bacterium]|nr:methylated-DNA--[protein]-cysteine S-methyltransferase [Candidatus Peribacteraceae bacterium]
MPSAEAVTTPIGVLQITGSSSGIERIAFVRKGAAGGDVPSRVRACARQLREYFQGERTEFRGMKLKRAGTAFQRKVWRELKRVPYGRTVTYGEIARRIGHPRAAQAVGSAVRANPLAILIPCHRVIPARGGVGEYAGGKLRKRWLVKWEEHSSRYVSS